MNLSSRIAAVSQALAIVSVGAFLFTAVFGMTFGMQTDERGNMSDCPFMSERASVCSMGVVEHLAKWQQLFNVDFSRLGDFAYIIFLLLALIFFAAFARATNISPLALAFSPSVPKSKPEAKRFDHLVIAFSRGILNPRLYA